MANKSVVQVDVTKMELMLPRLSEAFDGLRIVQISDIHFGTWINRPRLDRMIELVNRQNPDVVAITGDFVTDDPERHADHLIAGLSNLKPHEVSVAVMGNHDHWTDPAIIAQVLNKAGVVNLNNAIYTLNREGYALHLAGVDCTYENADRLDWVVQKIPSQEAAILLVHEPDYADTSADTGRFDLQLSGHSHGGQVVLPIIGAPILPRYARKYPSGRYQVNGMILYANRGLGTAHLQIRINCPPEISVFTLRAPSV